jgi:FlaA1/EpsC-like NDP-sugar epimerase
MKGNGKERTWGGSELQALRGEFGAVYGGRTVLVTGADGFMGSHAEKVICVTGARSHIVLRGAPRG